MVDGTELDDPKTVEQEKSIDNRGIMESLTMPLLSLSSVSLVVNEVISLLILLPIGHFTHSSAKTMPNRFWWVHAAFLGNCDQLLPSLFLRSISLPVNYHYRQFNTPQEGPAHISREEGQPERNNYWSVGLGVLHGSDQPGVDNNLRFCRNNKALCKRRGLRKHIQ